MNRTRSTRRRLAAPIIVSLGLLPSCGGAQHGDNPPGHEHPVDHENPPAVEHDKNPPAATAAPDAPAAPAPDAPK
jgi:hypothetical protein